MMLFLTSLLASSLIAQDKNMALMWILNFIVEGIILYFLVINVVRNIQNLKHIIWLLIIASGFLGSLSLYQELADDYSNTFGGLAQRRKDISEYDGPMPGENSTMGIEKREKVSGVHRAGGPLGAPNRYSQFMLMILPLAVFRFWGEDRKKMRLFALSGTLLILSGIFLSYSRGGFLTLMLMAMLLTFMRYVKPVQLVKSFAVLILIMGIAAPGYFARLDSIRGVQGLFSQDAEVEPDGPTRGRLTEMLAAFTAFLDYPILGVGPGQYTPFYSAKYQTNEEIMFRYLDKNRRAHILYFELMAETGILGFSIFMAIAILVLHRLWQIRRQTLQTRPDLANIATSFWFAIIAYLGTAVFLHLSYQRYYWLILALASAAVYIIQEEIIKEPELDVAV